MDTISLHRNSVDRYQNYIRSFIDIHDEDIRREVSEQLAQGKLWPEPLVHFNPAYQAGSDLKSLVSEGVLEKETSEVFSGFALHWHQEQALRLGSSGNGFVVTSGTGSGKSLTYIGTIFNKLFAAGAGKGVKALIVYPMNALVNSQNEELKRHAEQYFKTAGKPFPITFNEYTGQTKAEVRQQILDSPPDILLTNYMMLELLLTRAGEEQLRNSIFGSLEFLAFDELHTYRGRQGADISYLIRRIKALTEHKVICMGTSATMASEGDYDERQAVVASIASTIFGENITKEQVIGEKLARSLKWEGTLPSGDHLEESFTETDSIEKLRSHPLAVWLENVAALEETAHGLQRRKPRTAGELANDLSAACSLSLDDAKNQIQGMLRWIAAANKKQTDAGVRYTCMPFRLHQFFAQAGSVYATMGTLNDRTIRLEPGIYEGEDEFLFPHVFSRASGNTFICVHVHQENGRFLPREFNDTDSRKGNDFGYVIPRYPGEEEFWTGSQDDLALLPPSWTNESQAGLSIKRAYSARVPKSVYYNRKGYFSSTESEECPLSGWFMSAKKNGLLFDPTAGLFFDGNTNERTKLTTLGNEGRSTSTTITSFILLTQLAEAGVAPKDQKLLSFTDNRQDAALQSGHFNDFIKIVRIRSAICHALEEAGGKRLKSSQLGPAIREALDLDIGIYSDNTSPFPGERNAINESLEKFLVYQAIHDLRRGWRVVLPNLEKCALLEIEYEGLKENAEYEEGWASVPIFNDIDPEKRADLIRDVLDFFRLEYAITSNTWLEQNNISENIQLINSKLRPEWRINQAGEVHPSVLRRTRLHWRHKGRSGSLGITSGLGKYLKLYARKYLDLNLNRELFEAFMDEMLQTLVRCGYIVQKESRDQHNHPAPIYQMVLEKMIWKLGDGKTVRRDVVKRRSYLEDLTEKPNAFFQQLYQTNFKGLKNLIGADHTGQLKNEDRIEREDQFRVDGPNWTDALINARSISALFCSPTMELGIDISQLSIVHMRNAPPNPANYAQRSGRAGRSGQTALVFNYCSAYSPHDRHYFEHRQELVAGTVEPPRLDIANRELIRSHLHAVFMTKVGLPNVRQAVTEIVDLEQDNFPLRDEVRRALELSTSDIDLLVQHFEKVLIDRDGNPGLVWCDNEWLARQLKSLPKTLDEAMDRWRSLYRESKATLNRATNVQNSGRYDPSSEEYKRADREVFQATRQLALLRNDQQSAGQQSEFYVFRYLAAEGFLPGYNFTRLPMRAFLTDGHERGEFISRPRPIALREFGPQNIIYHNARKYRIEQSIVPNVSSVLTKARVCTTSGYWLDQGQETIETCPLTGTDLSAASNRKDIAPLFPLCEMLARQREYITCEEEERMRQGFEMKTFFSLDGGDGSRMKRALVEVGTEPLLKLSYLPAARLIHLSEKDRRETEEGFRIGLQTGFWNPKINEDDPDAEEVKRVQLFTETTADALYIQPIEALALEPAGILSLQYALKRAIEVRFQIEPSELGVFAMGSSESPNIFFYESAEGSLGVLSAIVDDPNIFREVIEQAIEICDFKDTDRPKATYNDLLSYYNQPHHLDLDRFSIEDALDKLKTCTLDCSDSSQDVGYESQFERLLRQLDPNSSTEEKFIRYLHKKNLRLPEAAQKTVEGIFVQPDFFYEPDTWVFCDGTPHDKPEVKADDAEKRKAIRARGDEVIVYYYKDDLDEIVARYPDIFKPVR